MKRAVLIVVCLLLLVIPAMGCVDDAAAPAKPLATQEFVNTKDTELKALIDQKAPTAYVDQKFSQLPASAGYTKAEVDAIKATLEARVVTQESKVTTLESKVAALETKVAQWTNPVPGQPTPIPGTPVGQVSYTIQNMPAGGFWQFSTPQNISIRIYNNKPETRYVRPQLTITTYQNQIAGTVTVVVPCTVLSNSQGQAAVTFTPTPIPAAPNTTQVLFYASAGGVMNGQYLLGPGTAMDILVQIHVTNTPNAVLWTFSVTGSDTNLSGT